MRRAGGGGGGGSGEDKVMGPLFPRLHVNDTTLKGGGPRAPPRNKMALYEQFSVPSQRFAANTAPAAHRPAASFAAVSSASAGQAAWRYKSCFALPNQHSGIHTSPALLCIFTVAKNPLLPTPRDKLYIGMLLLAACLLKNNSIL
uniref:Early flowering protein 3 mutant eam8.k n=1 Tax=Hordeum vulgare TaxID=4513 RepID=H6DAG6_HORVU|nr:early flowering protein 3 mutant eam8.k [Hordeum vulgare]